MADAIKAHQRAPRSGRGRVAMGPNERRRHRAVCGRQCSESSALQGNRARCAVGLDLVVSDMYNSEAIFARPASEKVESTVCGRRGRPLRLTHPRATTAAAEPTLPRSQDVATRRRTASRSRSAKRGESDEVQQAGHVNLVTGG